MKVGIIGGGIMGVCLGYYLSEQGAEVEIFEASSTIGGLAGSITLEDGTRVDRFYHALLSSDSHLSGLCNQLGIADQLRFNETRMGFFYRGRIHSMNNVLEFLRFPPLGWIDRFRLGLTVLYAQFVKDWHKLESISVEKWLLALSGKGTYKNIWLPMLKAKFDGGFENTPATYIWSRLVRMKSTRSGANQKEQCGHLIGGYMTLIEAMTARILTTGGLIHLRKPVSRVDIENGRAVKIITGNESHRFDVIISTIQPPVFQRMLPNAPLDYRELLGGTQYLGIVCPLLVLDRPLSGYWTLNLTDDSLPFTGIIETTSYIDPQYVGGHHLVYLPKYTAPGSRYQDLCDEEIKAQWLSHLETMFPSFQRSWIRDFQVHREKYVEPLHVLNGTHLIPPIQTPIENLYLVSNAQIYPALTNVESISRKAQEVAALILNP
ncbi:NAD(P)/FAD-dependent oxidoreductase [Candidatus Villigracilis affinis]|uniref:NAD(P)/FAD-dependent oxidoreductase n=1 Tax=Candidatus Villigracilis affinis TaxID=3140682 RepID=UPI002A2243E8|nr:NAD(P)/FAD-dependent oxidoreductase [Anaerolineales bacterium]